MLEFIYAALRRMSSEEQGQTAVEYALVLLLVAAVVAGVMVTPVTTLINDAITGVRTAAGL